MQTFIYSFYTAKKKKHLNSIRIIKLRTHKKNIIVKCPFGYIKLK